VFHLDSFGRRSFHPISWAPADESGVDPSELHQDFWAAMMAAGAAPASSRNTPSRDYLSENLLRQMKARESRPQTQVEDYNLTRLHQDDQDALELVVSLVTEGFFDGDQ